ncbi:hypothetical protein Esti_003000 [Eimeria stiedai]
MSRVRPLPRLLHSCAAAPARADSSTQCLLHWAAKRRQSLFLLEVQQQQRQAAAAVAVARGPLHALWVRGPRPTQRSTPACKSPTLCFDPVGKLAAAASTAAAAAAPVENEAKPSTPTCHRSRYTKRKPCRCCRSCSRLRPHCCKDSQAPSALAAAASAAAARIALKKAQGSEGSPVELAPKALEETLGGAAAVRRGPEETVREVSARPSVDCLSSFTSTSSSSIGEQLSPLALLGPPIQRLRRRQLLQLETPFASVREFASIGSTSSSSSDGRGRLQVAKAAVRLQLRGLRDV